MPFQMEKNPVAQLNILGKNGSKRHFGTTRTEKIFSRMNLLSSILHIPTKDSKLMKYGNAHFPNCAVIGPQNRHKNKRNLSLERVQGVTNLKNHISETIWSTEIKFCMAL